MLTAEALAVHDAAHPPTTDDSSTYPSSVSSG